LLHMLYLFTET